MRHKIYNWWLGMARVFRREFRIVRKDGGALLFFIALPLLYPVTYTLIYNPEIVTKCPVAVVDNCRTAASRQFVQEISAAPAIDIYGYATDLNEAKDWMGSNKVAAIFEIPRDYDKKIGQGEQATVPMYFDMQLLLKYRALYSAVTEYQMHLTQKITLKKIESMGASSLSSAATPMKSEANFLGDPEQGFASFVIPGILVLILQQSLVLGVCLLGASSRERRRVNGGYDPLMVSGVNSTQLIFGKALCYLAIYVPMTFYVLHFIPEIFELPHYGDIWTYLAFIFPMMLASVMFGMVLNLFVTERESSFVVIVFTSVLFLFLSGLTWPRYAITGIWSWLGDLVPATWGVQGFIRINSNNASLSEVGYDYMWLWILAVVYFLLAWAVTYWLTQKEKIPGYRPVKFKDSDTIDFTPPM